MTPPEGWAAVIGVVAAVLVAAWGVARQLLSGWTWTRQSDPGRSKTVATDIVEVIKDLATLHARVNEIDRRGGSLDVIRVQVEKQHVEIERLHHRLEDSYHRIQESMKVQVTEIDTMGQTVRQQSVVVGELFKEWSRSPIE